MDPRKVLGATGNRIDIEGELPISSLLSSQLRILGMSTAQAARRLGYETTVAKGVRRLSALIAGDLKHINTLREPLTNGLAIDQAVLDKSIEDTRHVLWARDDRDYRINFALHVVWKTALSTPSPITVAAISGARSHLLWYPSGIDPAHVSEAVREIMPDGVPCYGKVTGYYVNYSPDCAVHFNPHGEPLEVLSHAVRPGATRVRM